MKVFTKHKHEILGLGIIVLVFLLIVNSSRGEQVTKVFFDPIRTIEERKDIVVLGIDDTTLQTLGAWPFDRSVFASVVNLLNQAKARAVVFDILFLEKRSGDELLRQALDASSIPIILGSKLEQGKYSTPVFIPSPNPLVTQALVNVQPDRDGKVRNFSALSRGEQGKCLYGLAEHTFRLLTFKNVDLCEKGETSFRYLKNIETYSLSQVLSKDFSLDVLRGKIIFIGSTSLDLEDHFVSLSGEKIGGVYVHASMLGSFLETKEDTILYPYISFGLILLYMGLVLCGLKFTKHILGQLGIVFLLTVSIFLIAFIGFSYGVMIPAPWLLGIIFITMGYSTLVRFLHEKKQGEFVQSLFSKYVHKDVLKKLLDQPDSINFEGEKRTVSVLFSDLRGFTTLSESLTPEELTKTLNAYFSAMTVPILEEHGTIDKYIGDAVMAFWNAPLPVPDHRTHAVCAGLRMHQALDLFNQEHGTSLAMGVGIHSGDVIVGNVGSQDRINYTILGDTVNLSSRIEGLTKKYGVRTIITEDVVHHLPKKDILARKLDSITVKGKNKPTVLYEVVFTKDGDHDVFREYEKAFELYQKKAFEEALKIFRDLSEKGDAPSHVMCERVTLVKNDPLFDGVWRFDEK